MTRNRARASLPFLIGLVLAAPGATAQEHAAQQLAENSRIDAALNSLKPQRPGTVDAYVVVIALDSDTVFGREARETGQVLASRFDAVGRTIVLASDEGDRKADAPGSPRTLELALARDAQLMDRNEDVLVLYTTSHGEPGTGLVYKDDSGGADIIPPRRLAGLLDSLGFRNRLLILQACYSGQFVPALRRPGTVVVTAAAEDRPSFGCQAGNDWTLFGTALVNHAFRQPLPLDVQVQRAKALIAAAEERAGLEASNPQFYLGSDTSVWRNALDARAPKVATAPVGEPVQGLGI